jgi:hypothetical protein
LRNALDSIFQEVDWTCRFKISWRKNLPTHSQSTHSLLLALCCNPL